MAIISWAYFDIAYWLCGLTTASSVSQMLQRAAADRTHDFPRSRLELAFRAKGRILHAVLRAVVFALAVDGLAASHDDLAHRQSLVDDQLEEQGCAVALTSKNLLKS